MKLIRLKNLIYIFLVSPLFSSCGNKEETINYTAFEKFSGIKIDSSYNIECFDHADDGPDEVYYIKLSLSKKQLDDFTLTNNIKFIKQEFNIISGSTVRGKECWDCKKVLTGKFDLFESDWRNGNELPIEIGFKKVGDRFLIYIHAAEI
ncbi:MAG TPA: hypothetical protein VK177_21100 [Flavobacteriales bacterium]|nr:hypothetical protein [Flavobacteriales bacterium]